MRYITLAIALLIGISAEAQIIRAEPFYTAPEAVGGNLLLDDYPGAAVAYSLRKLDKDYTGSAIRVRRSSDNTEQDIGFVNNYLDTASMKTFVGANNGFVVTWYNQADSSGVFGIKPATNATANQQPKVIESGSVIYDEGYVGVSYDTLTWLGFQPGVASNAVYSVIEIKSRPSAASRMPVVAHQNAIGSPASVAYSFYPELNGSAFLANTNTLKTLTTYTNSTRILAISINADNTAANLKAFVDGSQISFNTSAASSRETGALNSLNKRASVAYGKGVHQEVIVYPSDQSSNRTAIESNINSFYSIY